MSKIKSSLTGLLRPYSMELKKEYLERFESDPFMQEMLLDPTQRANAAESAWKNAWMEASVTVTLLDGSQYMIH